MKKKKKTIGHKVAKLLLTMIFLTMFLMGGISVYGLYSMKEISESNSRRLGQTAADGAEEALEEMAGEHLQSIVVEKAAYIEEKFRVVESYVLGIAAQAADIYKNPEAYPDREVAPPERVNGLTVQLLYSENLEMPTDEQKREVLKLGNIQDLLLQYNAHNDMVSSDYVATQSGWMIQADYIANSKYSEDGQNILPYEAAEREWYQRAQKAEEGQVVYTDVIRDVHKGGDGIVCASPVYYEGQVVAVAGVGSYLETINQAVLNTIIGGTGYAFLVNEKGQVMVSPKTEGDTAALAEESVDLRENNNKALAAAAESMTAGESGFLQLTLDGRQVYLAYAPLEKLGWSFAAVMDVEEVIAPAKESQEMILKLTEEVENGQNAAIQRMLLSFGVMFVAIIFAACLFGALFSQKLAQPIHRLTMEVAQIDGGNLDGRIHIATGDEVEDLGNAFNNMTEQVQKYIKNLASVTAEKERIRTEIEVASRLQADMLPEAENAFGDRKEFVLYASMTPAKGVGGDFYDFFLLDEDHLALVMADVSGKGVPAALFMVVSRTLIRSHVMSGGTLTQAVEDINESLCKNNKNGMFVTAWIGVLTISTGELTFVNAGHCRPLLRHADGFCEYAAFLSGLVLAGMEEARYRQSQLYLKKGDTILLYTDGVTEATSVKKELYGEKRLRRAAGAGAVSVLTPKELLERIWEDVDRFQKDAEQFDDITMLALTYNGNGLEEKSGEPDMENIKEFADFVSGVLKENGVSIKTSTKVQMTVDEIFSNICYYSGAKEVTVGVRVTGKEKKEIVLFFEDDGMAYNP
ncbi:MAG: SpoIIE family protein phosphatase, partial [Lachnospiraceae bacterium]|nr:SpoIIE family protein phosphatase [Lachnospiraceae bacterium]